MPKKALGKGLSALLPPALLPPARPASATAAEGRLLEIDLAQIRPNRYQPRRPIAEGDLGDLAATIKAQGLLQPVMVRRGAGGGYELIAGERRWRAARQAGLRRIPAVLRDATEAEMLELALVENLQRKDLTPLETASAYQRLMKEFRLSQKEVAERVGQGRASIANVVRLLSLPLEVKDALAAEKITAGHAKALLSLPSPEAQRRLAHKIIREGLSVRETERAVQRWQQATRKARPLRRLPRAAVEIADAVERLQRRLGTKVRINGSGRSGRGQILIEYYSGEDLTRLVDILLK